MKRIMNKGFTLIELLASLFVIVTVGFIVVAILVSSLRGVNKTNTISTARQNGTYLISQMSKMLRFAKSVDELTDASGSVSPPTECITNIPLPTPQQSLASYSSITFTSIDGGQTTLSCDSSTSTISSNSASLLDTSVVQIPAGTCYFTCNQSTSSDALIVGIHFNLDTIAPTGTTLLPEFTSGTSAIEFGTSVILRNVGR